MTLDKFNEAVAKTRLHEPARTMARLVLVDGYTPVQAAGFFGRARNEAWRAKKRVLEVA